MPHLKLIGKSADSSEGSRSLESRFGAMIADAMVAKIILNPERLLDLLGKGSVSADPSPPSGLAAPFAPNSLGQRMADLAQLGLQRQKLLCSRSC